MIEMKPDTFGGVLLSASGRVLLREPLNHYGGYAWTFPKGRPATGESAQASALRHTRLETGYHARILGLLAETFAGTASRCQFYAMEAMDPPSAFDRYTQGVQWVSFEDARSLIEQSTTTVGRQRDLRVLAAARHLWQSLPEARRPAVIPQDWASLSSMPARHILRHVRRRFTPDEMAILQRGLLPDDQDDRWLVYLSGSRLMLHRSWTGLLIFEVLLQPTDDGGMEVASVLINRDPEQFGSTDDAEDLILLESLLRMLLT